MEIPMHFPAASREVVAGCAQDFRMEDHREGGALRRELAALAIGRAKK
jgi:hypothetical protein